jgi:hypothetical protein
MKPFESLITTFNAFDDFHVFTSSDLKAALPSLKPSSVYSFLDVTHLMGALERFPITEKVSRGPKYEMIKVRSINQKEKTALTTYPDCINFKKKLLEKKKGEVKVKSYTRRKPSKKAATKRKLKSVPQSITINVNF